MIDSVEAKQLIKLNEKFLKLAEATNTFRNNVKAVKLYLKIVGIEIKQLKNSKQPIAAEHESRVLKQYTDLQTTLKHLVKTKKIQEINKYCAEIDEIIASTEKWIFELKGANAMNNISAASQKVASVIGNAAQKIGDAVSDKLGGAAQKIGDAVSGKIGDIKKMFAAEENSKSE